ncbi:MAG: hypothetical protein NWE89_06980, partial [Candidatus Bathyarchaeota archaeon]|nr:hypothetical protein [Candidatus Bathyarchaeota archaeon]
DGKSGYLVMSKRKLVFVHVKGFLSKSYSILMNVPLSEISDLTHTSRYKFEISFDDKKHVMDTGELSSNIVLTALNELREAVPAVS